MNISLNPHLPFPTPVSRANNSAGFPDASPPVSGPEAVASQTQAAPASAPDIKLPLDDASALGDAAGTRIRVKQAVGIKERFSNLMESVNESAAKLLSGLDLDEHDRRRVEKEVGKFEKEVRKGVERVRSGDKSVAEVEEKLEHKLDKLADKLGKVLADSTRDAEEANDENNSGPGRVGDDDHHTHRHHHRQHRGQGHGQHDEDDLTPVVSFPGNPGVPAIPKTPVVPTKPNPETPIVDSSLTPSVADVDVITVQPVADPPQHEGVDQLDENLTSPTITPRTDPENTIGPAVPAPDSPVIDPSPPTVAPLPAPPEIGTNFQDMLNSFRSSVHEALRGLLDALSQLSPVSPGVTPGTPSNPAKHFEQFFAFAAALQSPGSGVDHLA